MQCEVDSDNSKGDRKAPESTPGPFFIWLFRCHRWLVMDFWTLFPRESLSVCIEDKLLTPPFQLSCHPDWFGHKVQKSAFSAVPSSLTSNT